MVCNAGCKLHLDNHRRGRVAQARHSVYVLREGKVSAALRGISSRNNLHEYHSMWPPAQLAAAADWYFG